MWMRRADTSVRRIRLFVRRESMAKDKKHAPRKTSKGRENKGKHIEDQREASESTEAEAVIETLPPFALVSDGHIYIHESELAPEVRRGRVEWKGVRLTPEETEQCAEEFELIMPEVATALRIAMRDGLVRAMSAKPKSPATEDAEPVNAGADPETETD
jgi:hypothetical protein